MGVLPKVRILGKLSSKSPCRQSLDCSVLIYPSSFDMGDVFSAITPNLLGGLGALYVAWAINLSRKPPIA